MAAAKTTAAARFNIIFILLSTYAVFRRYLQDLLLFFLYVHAVLLKLSTIYNMQLYTGSVNAFP